MMSLCSFRRVLPAALAGAAALSSGLLAQTAPAPAGAPTGAQPSPWMVVISSSGDDLVIVRPNGIAARVEDRIITIDQVFKEMKDQIQTLWDKSREDNPYNTAAAQARFKDEFNQLPFQTAQKMVDRLLVINDFYAQGYQVPKAFITQHFDETLMRNFGNDRAAYHNYLQANGLTEAEYRRKLEEDLVYGYMMGKLQNSVTAVSPAQVTAFYEQHKERYTQEPAVKLRQIVLKPLAGEPRDLLMQEANAIVAQARGGADFGELARAKSQDVSAKNGGVFFDDWITMRNGSFGYAESIDSHLVKLNAGDITDPIVDLDGNIRIFKCDAKRPGGVQPLSEVQRNIEAEIAKLEAIAAQEKWIAKLRAKSYWNINL